MALAPSIAPDPLVSGSVPEIRAAGRAAAEVLAEAERMRARAVLDLVAFDAIDAHAADGYVSPQRHLVHAAGISDAEAARLVRLVRFLADHPTLRSAIDAGDIGLDHLDVLRTAAERVSDETFHAGMEDLLAAADGVELSIFAARVRTWLIATTDSDNLDDSEAEESWDRRSVTWQLGLFGNLRGQLELDPAGAAVFAAALDTPPDPDRGPEPPRTLAQRRADKLVDLCHGTELDDHPACGDTGTDPDPVADEDPDLWSVEPHGARRSRNTAVEVVIDLATLTEGRIDLDAHRSPNGDIDWDSIHSSTRLHTLTGPAATLPPSILERFLCDTTWRTIVTDGHSQVLDITDSTSDLTVGQRRAVRQRDHHCQFNGCDRPWNWCDVHHLVPRREGGESTMSNLALVCRRHHTMIHTTGWTLARAPDGTIITTSP